METSGPAISSEVTQGKEVCPSTLRDFSLYFLRLGTVGFGGPIALVGHNAVEKGRKFQGGALGGDLGHLGSVRIA